MKDNLLHYVSWETSTGTYTQLYRTRKERDLQYLYLKSCAYQNVNRTDVLPPECDLPL